jgi:hypothetical protein
MNCQDSIAIAKPFWGEACPVKSFCERKNTSIVVSVLIFHTICCTNFHTTRNKAIMGNGLNRAENGLHQLLDTDLLCLKKERKSIERMI